MFLLHQEEDSSALRHAVTQPRSTLPCRSFVRTQYVIDVLYHLMM